MRIVEKARCLRELAEEFNVPRGLGIAPDAIDFSRRIVIERTTLLRAGYVLDRLGCSWMSPRV